MSIFKVFFDCHIKINLNLNLYKKKEINRRLQSEKLAQDEIERLRRELENLKNRPPPVNRPTPEPVIIYRDRTPQPAPVIFKMIFIKNVINLTI